MLNRVILGMFLESAITLLKLVYLGMCYFSILSILILKYLEPLLEIVIVHSTTKKNINYYVILSFMSMFTLYSTSVKAVGAMKVQVYVPLALHSFLKLRSSLYTSLLWFSSFYV